jgi:hypothetical protein
MRKFDIREHAWLIRSLELAWSHRLLEWLYSWYGEGGVRVNKNMRRPDALVASGGSGLVRCKDKNYTNFRRSHCLVNSNLNSERLLVFTPVSRGASNGRQSPSSSHARPKWLYGPRVVGIITSTRTLFLSSIWLAKRSSCLIAPSRQSLGP